MADEPQTDTLAPLLDYLNRTRGFDFSAYKPASLQRRIQKRLEVVGVEGYADYIDYLEVHPDEFQRLFNTILINVTEFFRDPPAWEAISEVVLPRLLAAKQPTDLLRVWSAGCATGQEAYTIAMLLAEALGDEAYHERVKVYATDVSEAALAEARVGAYTESQVQSVPEALRAKYFEPNNDVLNFRKDLRRSVIFGCHDLLQDAPISRVDLLICRNTLMYFNAESQAHVLSRFDFALNGGGYLFLGKAEVMLTRSSAFVPLDVKHRVFLKTARAALPQRAAPTNLPETVPSPERSLLANRLRDLALEVDPTAQVVLDLDGDLVLANAQARQLFNLQPGDITVRPADAPALFRPLDLRFTIEQSLHESRMVQVKEVEWISGTGERRYFDVLAFPLLDADRRPLGIKLHFTDVTRVRHLQEELHHSHQELETANEELQSSNEELETTNEELQSTVEELETTNEELDTMNEELQSTNEELQTANQELRVRGEDMHRLNAFLESIMAGLRDGVVVLDTNLVVRAWNNRAEDMWGLRSGEVLGQHFLGLDIGLPVDQLKPLIRSGLVGDGPPGGNHLDLKAISRRGKPMTVHVNVTRLMAANENLQGLILVMEEIKPDGASDTQ